MISFNHLAACTDYNRTTILSIRKLVECFREVELLENSAGGSRHFRTVYIISLIGI